MNCCARYTPCPPRRLTVALWLAFAAPSLALPLAAGAQSAGITDLGTLNGGGWSRAYGVSADGSVVVGMADNGAAGGDTHAFRWTLAGGMTSLGTLNGGSYSSAAGVSADGAVVVGGAYDGAAGDTERAFRWTQAGGMQSLGVLNGGQWSRGKAVSANGEVVVGDAIDGAAANEQRAFRWTQAGGMVSLGVLNGGSGSEARGVSADGSVVVGVSKDGAAGNWERAFRWTQAGGMQSLGVLNGGSTSYTSGVSADGAVVAGTADDGAAGFAWQAFRWTQAGGMQSLGRLNGGNSSLAYGISGDGAVVVGAAHDGNDLAWHGFRWTQAAGMQSVEDWLRAAGVAVAGGVETDIAYATNSDGSVVVGELKNGQAFIARVAGNNGGSSGGGTTGGNSGGGTTGGNSGGGLGSGLITLVDVQASLGAGAAAGAMALRSNDLLINGAHGRPFARRVAAGQNAFWLAGDLGRDDHGRQNGDLGLVEAGGGHNFGPLQLNVSLGQTWAQQNLVLDGRVKTEGTYLLAEALIPIASDLWATLGGYRHWGKADLKRGYLNAGNPDYSSGRPDIHSWGLRARLEYEQDFVGGKMSPYVDLSYSEAKLDGYTEHGGGFAARFDSRKERATELRLGANFARPLVADTRLVGLLEAAHRFEKDGVRTSGEMLGLFAFDLGGRKNRQDWLRAGIGLESRIAGGTGSLMLNATTQGEVPNYWLAAGWQLAF